MEKFTTNQSLISDKLLQLFEDEHNKKFLDTEIVTNSPKQPLTGKTLMLKDLKNLKHGLTLQQLSKNILAGKYQETENPTHCLSLTIEKMNEELSDNEFDTIYFKSQIRPEQLQKIKALLKTPRKTTMPDSTQIFYQDSNDAMQPGDLQWTLAQFMAYLAELFRKIKNLFITIPPDRSIEGDIEMIILSKIIEKKFDHK